MTTSRRTLFSTLLGFLISSLFVGCGQKPEAKVDISAQIAGLKSPDKDTRINACVEIAKAGPNAASAVPTLIPLLKDADAEVRKLASYALYEIGPAAKAAISAVREHLNDPDRYVAAQAVNTLRAIDPTAADLKPLPNVMTGNKP